jgi:hypothetical protein
MFPRNTLKFFQDARLCDDKGYFGIGIGGLMEAYSNWGEHGGRLQAVGFKVEVKDGNRVLHSHVRIQTSLLQRQNKLNEGGSSSIDTPEGSISGATI